MNNSTRNLKMKKLLIASTALVAAAGMASADITISGHAAAGIYSGLGNKNGKACNYFYQLRSKGLSILTTHLIKCSARSPARFNW